MSSSDFTPLLIVRCIHIFDREALLSSFSETATNMNLEKNLPEKSS